MGDLFQPTHLLVLAFFFGLFFLIPKIFYILTVQNALKRCHPSVCTLDPALCWLYLVPFVGMIWHFFMVSGVGNSLGGEFMRRGLLLPEPKPGQSIGIPMCVCGACSIIPALGLLAAVAQLVLWIVYWSRIADFSRQLDLQMMMQSHPAQ